MNKFKNQNEATQAISNITDYLLELKSRWSQECDFEDFNNYKKLIKAKFEKMGFVVENINKSFIIEVSCELTNNEDLKVTIKVNQKSLKLLCNTYTKYSFTKAFKKAVEFMIEFSNIDNKIKTNLSNRLSQGFHCYELEAQNAIIKMAISQGCKI